MEGFSEKGSLAPLAIHSDSAESLRSDVGFRAFYQLQIGKIVVEPSLKAVWEHEYKYSALPITAGFARDSRAIVDILRSERRSRQRGRERRYHSSMDADDLDVSKLRRATWARKLRFKCCDRWGQD
jgi:hypothetical protein